MVCIVTIATGDNALRDFKVLVESTTLVYEMEGQSLPAFYVYTNRQTAERIRDLQYKGVLRTNECLNAYQAMTRKQMEKMPGIRYKTLWTDFMAEKINAMRWAFSERLGSDGIWFLDADICLLAPLPTIEQGIDLALSPHWIRAADEAKYGRFNGGFLWMQNPAYLDIWEKATTNSRFFEQAALEDVGTASQYLQLFPQQVNFGWWRLWQSPRPVPEMQGKFGFNRTKVGVGLTFEGEVLQSVHTHFYEKEDPYTMGFNQFLVGLLEKLGRHKPAQELLRIIRNASGAV
jgi:hypothetical protein